MKFPKLVCAVAPSLCTYLGIAVDGSAALQRPHIRWGPCSPSLGVNPSLSCGTFEIPLDYHNHSAGTGHLSLIKANATGERRGTVFMNPGGPGVSGIEGLNFTSALLLNQTGGVYDIVSWDTRGVGSLTIPGDVNCFASAGEQAALFSETIEVNGIEQSGNFTDPFDIQTLLAQASQMQQKYEELGKRCLEQPAGRYLRYVGTAATARDIAALADALDGPGSLINYIGLSYGTIIGSWLVNMFPERVGHVIIDGVVDASMFSKEDISLGWSQQLVDADKAYTAFFTGCTLAGPDACPFASSSTASPLDVHTNILALLQSAYDASRANSAVPVTSGQLRALLRPAMYSPSAWQDLVSNTLPPLIQAVHDEAQDDTKRSNIPARRFLDRRQQASGAPVPYNTEAIICSDTRDTDTNMTRVFDGIISTSQNISHMFGSAWPFATYYCPFWPVRAVERYEGPFNKTLANPILVIGNTYDPATPFAGAKATADALGDSATLVRLNAFRHTSQAEPSACLSNIVRAYMVNGTLPSGDDTVCEVDADFEVFTGVNTPAILANMPSGNF
ncbi:TAP-like protein-domain-containing protein [Daedaleopsis nitida]|nr:TAP-like protein-domain-containing protein [Daedaleopsis nitida]